MARHDEMSWQYDTPWHSDLSWNDDRPSQNDFPCRVVTSHQCTVTPVDRRSPTSRRRVLSRATRWACRCCCIRHCCLYAVRCEWPFPLKGIVACADRSRVLRLQQFGRHGTHEDCRPSHALHHRVIPPDTETQPPCPNCFAAPTHRAQHR